MVLVDLFLSWNNSNLMHLTASCPELIVFLSL